MSVSRSQRLEKYLGRHYACWNLQRAMIDLLSKETLISSMFGGVWTRMLHLALHGNNIEHPGSWARGVQGLSLNFDRCYERGDSYINALPIYKGA